MNEKTTILNFFDFLFREGDIINLTALPEKEGLRKTAPQVFFKNYRDVKKSFTDIDFKRYSEAGFNLCFCPNPILDLEKGRKKDNVKLNAFFVDIDNKDLLDFSDFPYPPSYIFKRGEKHFHIYWVLKTRLKNTKENRDVYQKIAEKLIQFFDGDKAVKDPSRLLRVPYSFHIKEKPYSFYRLYIFSGKKYSITELKTLIKNKAEKQETEKLGSENLEKYDERTILDFVFNSYLKQRKIFKGEGRSLKLYHFGCDCYNWGIEQKTAVDLANKINAQIFDPPESVGIVRHQIASAYKYANGDFGSYRSEYLNSTSIKKTKLLQIFLNEQKIRDVLYNWVYVAGAERLINKKTGFELTTQTQIQNYITHLSSVNVSFSKILEKRLIEVVEGIDFRPQISNRIFENHIGKNFNRFGGLEIMNTNLDINKEAQEIFIEHIKYLTTTDKEFETLLNYFSYIVQRPGEKLPYAALIISKHQGVGKSLLELLFRNIYTSKTGHSYVGSLENEQLSSGYTHFLVDRIFCFVHELNQGDKYGAMNKLKNLITEPFVEINAKYARPYTVKNTVNFVMFSNSPDAIKIEKNDRRLFVIYTEVEPKEQSYYKKLYEVFSTDYYSIFKLLQKRNLEKFNPFARPPMTAGKQQLITQSMSELNLFLTEAEKNKEGVFKNKIFTLKDLQNYVELWGPELVKKRVGQKAIRNYLIENDFLQYDFNKRFEKNRVHKIFWKKKIDKITENEILDYLKINFDEREKINEF